MNKIQATCSVCEEKTEQFYFCDDCGDLFCETCADIHLVNQGNAVDDIQHICDVCYAERRGMYV